jgi:hypothetical protein
MEVTGPSNLAQFQRAFLRLWIGLVEDPEPYQYRFRGVVHATAWGCKDRPLCEVSADL